ncbi:hypothetical protein [Saccharothrix sp. CCNWYY140]|uniref:hypothetical protein n=1 Tax=unclassified Saccharothrix TaxID=2593673 RepID=UPI003FD5BBAE
MQRRLGGHRTTFEQLVDEVRRERAERYLLESDLPLGHIAALLGCSEQSCLSRCRLKSSFRRRKSRHGRPAPGTVFGVPPQCRGANR